MSTALSFWPNASRKTEAGSTTELAPLGHIGGDARSHVPGQISFRVVPYSWQATVLGMRALRDTVWDTVL